MPTAMADAALASSHALAFEDGNLTSCPREASFSYLGTTDSVYAPRFGDEFPRSADTPVTASLGNSMKKGGADGELDVFGAEKYFSSGMDGDQQLAFEPEKPWKLPSPAKDVAFPCGKPSWSGTSSASSETSRQRRGSLLQDAKKGPSQNTRKPPQPAGGKKFLGIFCCSCVNNSSEETDGSKAGSWPEAGCNKQAGWQRTDKAGDSFIPKTEDHPGLPVLALNPVVVGNLTTGEEVLSEDRKGRRSPSMDGFRSPSLGTGALGASSLRRSLTMSAAFTSVATRDSDVCSESSSDLFEIEHISARTRPSGVDGASAMLCHEPSEGSIEWSIVTASAADFSVMSEVERSPKEVGKAREMHQHQRPGGLMLGCLGDKAVRISSNAYKFPEPKETADGRQRKRSMDTALPVIRYHAESLQLVNFDQRLARRVLVARGVIPADAAHRHCPH